MVSFSCEACNETMIKKKVQQHLGRCRAAVTCIDCSKTFPGMQYKDHNQCMTEEQKYQGKLYKPKDKSAKPTEAKPTKVQPKAVAEPEHSEQPESALAKKEKKQKSEKPAGRQIKVSKQTSLKKVLKKLEKEYKMDKKQLLNELVVGTEGRLTFASS